MEDSDDEGLSSNTNDFVTPPESPVPEGGKGDTAIPFAANTGGQDAVSTRCSVHSRSAESNTETESDAVHCSVLIPSCESNTETETESVHCSVLIPSTESNTETESDAVHCSVLIPSCESNTETETESVHCSVLIPSCESNTETETGSVHCSVLIPSNESSTEAETESSNALLLCSGLTLSPQNNKETGRDSASCANRLLSDECPITSTLCTSTESRRLPPPEKDRKTPEVDVRGKTTPVSMPQTPSKSNCKSRQLSVNSTTTVSKADTSELHDHAHSGAQGECTSSSSAAQSLDDHFQLTNQAELRNSKPDGQFDKNHNTPSLRPASTCETESPVCPSKNRSDSPFSTREGDIAADGKGATSTVPSIQINVVPPTPDNSTHKANEQRWKHKEKRSPKKKSAREDARECQPESSKVTAHRASPCVGGSPAGTSGSAHKRAGRRQPANRNLQDVKRDSKAADGDAQNGSDEGISAQSPHGNKTPSSLQLPTSPSDDYKISSTSSQCSSDTLESDDEIDCHSSALDREAKERTERFLSLSTLQEPSKDGPEGIQVLQRLLGLQGSVLHDDLSAEKIIQELTSRTPSDTQFASLRQTLVVHTLPRALRERDMSSVAVCLQLHNDPLVYQRAVQYLERLLISGNLRSSVSVQSQSSESSSKPQDILDVVDILCKLTKQNTSDQESTHRDRLHCHLHLMTACAFLCHPHGRKDNGLLQRFKTSITSLGESLDKKVPLRHFCHELEHAASSDALYHEDDWEHALQERRAGRSGITKLNKVNSAQLVQRAFSVTHAMAQLGWDKRLTGLSEELQAILNAFSKRVKKEVMASVLFFLVRCLTLLLTTTFKEDRQATAKSTCNAPALLADLLHTTLRKADAGCYNTLAKEIRCLLHHSSEAVRKTVVELWLGKEQSTPRALLSFVQDQLQAAQLKFIDLTQGEESRSGVNQSTSCKWRETRWRGPSGELLHGAILVQDKTCLPTSPSTKQCLSRHHSLTRQRSFQHTEHLEKLRQLGPHPNLVSLLVFQEHLSPCFYITENVGDMRLLLLLVDDRSFSPRLNTFHLLRMALQIVNALTFLDRRCLTLMDVTSHNMVYNLKVDDNGVIQDVLVKIANLGLTHRYKHEESYDNPEVRPHRDPGRIPIRWLPREALFQDRYDDKTMVYSFGWFLHELATRGCQPFTHLSLSTDDILLQLFLDSASVRAFQWPCIPDDMFILIRWATESKPEDRPSLQKLQHNEDCGILALMDKMANTAKKEFPVIDTDQEKRGYVPERGIKKIIEILSTTDPDQYKNLRLSSWESPAEVKVTNKELCAPDSVTISSRSGKQTNVRERLHLDFVNSDLQDLETCSQTLQCVVCWATCRRLSVDSSDYFLQERFYAESETLLDLAKRLGGKKVQHSADGARPHTSAVKCATQLCLGLARAVQSLHKQDWIHCDLRASHILVTEARNQIILARIGRMIQLKGQSSATGKRFEDNARWAPPEVLQHGIYSKEGDIFSLVTTFWEVLKIIETCASNSTAVNRQLVPLATIDITCLGKEVEKGVGLPKLQVCSPELEELIDKGRIPDRTARPTIEEIVQKLDEHVKSIRKIHRADEPNENPTKKAGLFSYAKKAYKKYAPWKRPGKKRAGSQATTETEGMYDTPEEPLADCNQTVPKHLFPSEMHRVNWNVQRPLPKHPSPTRNLGNESSGVSQDAVGKPSLQRPRLSYSLATCVPDMPAAESTPSSQGPEKEATVKSVEVVSLKNAKKAHKRYGFHESIPERQDMGQSSHDTMCGDRTNIPEDLGTQLTPPDMSRVTRFGDVVSPCHIGQPIHIDPRILEVQTGVEMSDRGGEEDYINTCERQFRPVVHELFVMQRNSKHEEKQQCQEASESVSAQETKHPSRKDAMFSSISSLFKSKSKTNAVTESRANKPEIKHVTIADQDHAPEQEHEQFSAYQNHMYQNMAAVFTPQEVKKALLVKGNKEDTSDSDNEVYENHPACNSPSREAENPSLQLKVNERGNTEKSAVCYENTSDPCDPVNTTTSVSENLLEYENWTHNEALTASLQVLTPSTNRDQNAPRRSNTERLHIPNSTSTVQNLVRSQSFSEYSRYLTPVDREFSKGFEKK